MQRKQQMTIPFVFLLAMGSVIYSQGGNYNVQEAIEKTGSSILITHELQALIERCSAEGGGTIYFPAGEYLTGSLVLKDNINLELSAGATLYGSSRMADYTRTDNTRADRVALISASGANNIGISGKGKINGQGDHFWRGKEHPITRPDRLIYFENSTKIRIEDISIINSPNWCIDVSFCNWIWIEGITILNERKAPNTDGIDPVSSKNIFISNCYIDTGDDAICPKSRGDVPTENLVVTNCILISDDSAIKLGTRSETFIRNALFSNIIIKNSDYGIAFYAKDGGTFENIRFNNIHIETTINQPADHTKPSGTYPIFLDLEKRKPDTKLGAIRNIFFSNITIDTYDGHCLFLGQPDSRIKNLQLTDIEYTLHKRNSFEGNKKPRGVRSLVDKAPNDYSDVPAHFAFAHVDGLVIENLKIHDLSENENNHRRMIWGYDVHEVEISSFKNDLAISTQELPLLHFKESSSIQISSSTPSGNASPFLFLEGISTRDVILQNNNLKRVLQPVKYDGTVDGAEIKKINNLTGTPEIVVREFKMKLSEGNQTFREEVLSGEIADTEIRHVAYAGPIQETVILSEGYVNFFLFIKGDGTLHVDSMSYQIEPETIAIPSAFSSVILKVNEGDTLHYLQFIKKLSPRDMEDLKTFPDENTYDLYFTKFSDCEAYTEKIKSPNTVSRTVLPADIIPRVSLGTVETLGPDAVGAHMHPMLDQLFLGLTSNDVTVHADDRSAEFKEYSLLHIPIGSSHWVTVEENKKMYYMWMDFFLTKEGEEWLKTHKPISTDRKEDY